MKIWQVTVTDPISWIPVLRVSPQNRWWCFALAIKLWRIGWQLANLPQTTRSSYPRPTTAPLLVFVTKNQNSIFPTLFPLFFPPWIDLIKYLCSESWNLKDPCNSWSKTRLFSIPCYHYFHWKKDSPLSASGNNIT